MRRSTLTPAAGALVLLCAGLAQAGPVQYPKTQTIDQTDEFFGTKVDDRYRWLEDDVRQSSQVKEWVTAQNKVTFDYLESLPEREPVRKELTKLWNYEKFSSPFRHGDHYFYYRNDGLQNQFVLHVADASDQPGRVLLDPNTWSKEGTVAMSGTAFTDDGKFMAYGIAKAGSDWSEWRVRDVATGQDLPDLVQWVKFSNTAWTKDAKGFFYSRFDEPKKGQEFQALNHFQKVYYHALGIDQSKDVLVFENKNEPEWGFGAEVSEDGQWLVITTSKGTDNKYRVDYKSLASPGAKFVNLIDKFEYDYSFIGNDGPVFFFFTDSDAPRGRVIAIDTTNPAPANWKTVVPQANEVLRSVNIVNNQFVCSYLKDATTQVRIFDKNGLAVRDVEFPALGTASGFGGRSHHTETFYSFSSFAVPHSIYRYDMTTGKSELLRRAEVDFNPDDYRTIQVFFQSKDHTKIPMFLTFRNDIELNGQNPVLLYGYGGFNIPITPGFSNTNAMWLKMGGVYASVCLRGGGEYGKDWHEA
ncbi:MAG TPA: S9 family peptidase, partial [Phycisphaerales bacterium]|nr:S9 family peptidase [Phycisphaerales bacterium]